MNYEHFLPQYPELVEKHFSEKILNKKEFNELSGAHSRNKYTEIIRRFLNVHSPYDELFVYNPSGVGNAELILTFTEDLLKSKAFKRVYVLTQSYNTLNFFIHELVHKFSHHRYKIPSNLQPETQWRELRHLVSDLYQFQTFENFVKEISKVQNAQEIYTDSIFVLDEVHNVVHDKVKYDAIFKLLSVVENRKILMLSCAPIRLKVSELSPLINLILPLDNQISVQSDEAETILLNPEDLKKNLKGRICYIAPPSPSENVVQVRYLGTFISTIEVEEFKVYGTLMIEPQLSAYLRAFQSPSKVDAILASSFVFPNGTWDKSNMVKYILDQEWFGQLRDITTLNRYSNKFAHVISNILSNPQKIILVYCPIKQILSLFSKVLELYGISNYETVKNKSKKYAFMDAKKIPMMNARRNMRGDECHVILANRESIQLGNLKNVQIIHILHPHISPVEQRFIIHRCAQKGLHESLIQHGFIPELKVYQHVSLINNAATMHVDMEKFRSVELGIYQQQQAKDILFKQLDQVLKESSFDYEQQSTKEDNTVEKDMDFSTYNLYYGNRQNLMNGIYRIFKLNYSIDFYTLQNILEADTFQLLHVLSQIITENIPLINARGIQCYLREQANEYYLVDNIALGSEHHDLNFYVRYPILYKRQSLQSAIRGKVFLNNLKKVRQIREAHTEEEVRDYLETLSLELQEFFLEKCLVIKYYENGIYDNPLIDWVENIYRSKNVLESNQTFNLISHLLEPRVRCFDGKHWVDYSSSLHLNPSDLIINRFTENAYGVYGILDESHKNTFCIKDFREAISDDGKMLDRRKIKTISTTDSILNKIDLIEICLHVKLPVISELQVINPKEKLMESKMGRKCLHLWKNASDDELRHILYWLELPRKQMLELLRSWFVEQGLLIKGNCQEK